jgi:hypothetical protein
VMGRVLDYFDVVAIPEPSSAALLSLSTMHLLMLRRERDRARRVPWPLL